MSDDTALPINEETSTPAAPMAVPPTPDETASEAQGEPAPSVLAPEDDAVPESAPTPAAEPARVQDIAEPDAESLVPEALAPEPQVREVIIEKEKPLTEADKDAIFQNKLKDNLAGANTRKQQKHEARLQEIVDFIRKKGTLATNQDIEEGLKILDTTVTRRLNELIQRGTLMRLGDQRHAKYKLINAV